MRCLRRLAGWLCACALHKWHRRYRHQRNIRRAARVLREIRAWQGPGQGARIIAYLRRCSPYVIEELVLSCLAEQGFRIHRNTRYTGDGGVDGRVLLNGRRSLIQVKRYRGHIRLADVQAFGRLVMREPGTGTLGLFVHTGRTGKGVRHLIRDTEIHVVSGQALAALASGKPVRLPVPSRHGH